MKSVAWLKIFEVAMETQMRHIEKGLLIAALKEKQSDKVVTY